MTRQEELVAALWGERGSPFDGFPHALYATDTQGWNSTHPYLAQTIREARPRTIVEVGVWKGRSTLTMARTVREMELDAAIVCVDSWVGSFEHWLRPDIFTDLKHQHGWPHLFYTFMANCVAEGVEDIVVPLPAVSRAASRILEARGVRPDLVHIDAGHDYDSVRSDLTHWWARLEPGGWLIADDYDPHNGVWPDVRRAVDDFLGETRHDGFESADLKCRFRKPA